MSSDHKQGPPYRAEHIGSLLRPAELRDAILGQIEVDDDKLSRITEPAVEEIVHKQVELGFCAPTDGEYRRIGFMGNFHLSLEGFEDVPEGQTIPLEAFRTYLPDVSDFLRNHEEIPYRTRCTSRIRHVLDRPIYEKEFLSLKALVAKGGHESKIVPKITLISPLWYYTLYREGYAYPRDAYTDDEEYLKDLSLAYRKEIDLLYGIGCRNIQIDDPYLTAVFCSDRSRAGLQADGIDPDRQFLRYMKFYTDCLAGKPNDLHIGMHMCRGNYINSRHFTAGSYNQIAQTLFTELKAVDTFYLEYDDSRSGSFEPLRFLPRDTNLILGVISSKFPQLEDLAELKARVFEAADYVADGSGQTRLQALDRLGVSPQCGFASHVLGNALTREDMWAKLKLVRQLADEIWPGQC